jgi:hypothetical protein
MSASLTGAATLRDALADIERPLLFERSAKTIGGALRTGRFLASFPRAALCPGPSRALRAILGRLGAPEQGAALLDRHQARAVSIHFGHEPEETGVLTKCYLEFPPDARPEPDLVFLALKWDGAGQEALSLYRSRDALSAPERRGLIRHLLPPGPALDLFEELGARPGSGLRLLEVEEPGSPRRSLDLGLADLGLRVGDHGAALAGVLGGTPAAQAWAAAQGGDRLGHLAAGVARDGRPFATVYHGVRRIAGPLP